MSEEWLDIPDERLEAHRIMRQIRARLADRGAISFDTGDEKPEAIAASLWQAMIENGVDDEGVPIQRHDCDIVPRNYVIDWRIPILGPIHAVIRRIINAEVRRYVSSSLEKQSYLNRQMLRALQDLVEENKRLRQEIKALREGQE